MARVKPKEITSWFDISRYEQLLDLTVLEVIDDLKNRVFSLYDYEDEDDADDGSPTLNIDEIRKSILKGLEKGLVNYNSLIIHDIISDLHDGSDEKNIPIIKDESFDKSQECEFIVNGHPIRCVDFFNKEYDEHSIEGESCNLFNIGDLVSYYRGLLRQGDIMEEVNKPVKVIGGNIFSSINKVGYLGDGFNDELVVKFNIGDYSDDELLTEFKGLLKIWRLGTEIDEPQKNNNRIGLSSLKKIFTYKVFPFIDLMLWEKINQKKISNELYARLLFPLSEGNIMGGVQIKDTVRPFVEKIIFDDFLRYLSFYVKKNEYLKDMRFSDVMKLAEI
ncbi:DUF6387 family protein [Xenorhabdus bovienii]|uniref:DUF6387 family protein n=2 Tax=Xenorhabdus bovienii TaxID=40576 RepID=UPI0023B23A95|nr:DUF6387 family protein [Xenorhabdus bovienii]MDE9445886.1 DUF6387 family protein [Xenorhabdus bovienii]MDE9526714.1 DUF6387 family protein [Xenorhabdus bovienii]MDE9569964.1 DUF6387 family protein [Xenorhabdus bovienii]MDE9586847.1 DUF6387 family protein [Xenorhabdus bovienii]